MQSDAGTQQPPPPQESDQVDPKELNDKNSKYAIWTRADPNDPGSHNWHMPYDKLSPSVRSDRVNLLNAINYRWRIDDHERWFPLRYRPKDMPQHPRDWSPAYLEALKRLAEESEGDLTLSLLQLHKVVGFRRGKYGKLCGKDVEEAARRVHDLQIEKRTRQAEQRNNARAQREAENHEREDNVHKRANSNANTNYSMPRPNRHGQNDRRHDNQQYPTRTFATPRGRGRGPRGNAPPPPRDPAASPGGRPGPGAWQPPQGQAPQHQQVPRPAARHGQIHPAHFEFLIGVDQRVPLNEVEALSYIQYDENGVPMAETRVHLRNHNQGASDDARFMNGMGPAGGFSVEGERLAIEEGPSAQPPGTDTFVRMQEVEDEDMEVVL